MERFNTSAIIIDRTDFGEADRIITFLSAERGKIKAIAKGVRKSRSKLAGALEIFSVSHVMILPGKGEINTLMSAKLVRHYGKIVKDLKRTEAAYDFMKLINKATQEKPEADYFHLLEAGLAALDEGVQTNLVDLWFKLRLIRLTGHMPNLSQDSSGQRLAPAASFDFDFEKMRFNPSQKGKFKVNDIKFLRLAFSAAGPKVFSKVDSIEKLEKSTAPLAESMLTVLGVR